MTKAEIKKALVERLRVANPSVVLRDVASSFKFYGTKRGDLSPGELLTEGELYESIAKRLNELSDLVHSIEEESK